MLIKPRSNSMTHKLQKITVWPINYEKIRTNFRGFRIFLYKQANWNILHPFQIFGKGRTLPLFILFYIIQINYLTYEHQIDSFSHILPENINLYTIPTVSAKSEGTFHHPLNSLAAYLYICFPNVRASPTDPFCSNELKFGVR